MVNYLKAISLNEGNERTEIFLRSTRPKDIRGKIYARMHLSFNDAASYSFVGVRWSVREHGALVARMEFFDVSQANGSSETVSECEFVEK